MSVDAVEENTVEQAFEAAVPADQRRDALVREVVAGVKAIERNEGVTRASLEKIRQLLLALAQRRDVFVTHHYPGPQRGSAHDIVFYRLAEDEDGRFSLYLSAALPGKESKPHNHKTWAVLVGIEGVEQNRIYEREDAGDVPGRARIRQARAVDVGPGTALALLPDDIHSIHVQGKKDEPVYQFRMYGRALPYQDERIKFDPQAGTYEKFPPNLNIKH